MTAHCALHCVRTLWSAEYKRVCPVYSGLIPAALTTFAHFNISARMIEFDSVQQAIAAHDSADYQRALQALGNGAERDIRIVESIA